MRFQAFRGGVGVTRLGPGDGTLTVRTGKGGAASKAGHNLVIEVQRWQVAEQEMRHEEENLRQAFDASPVPLVLDLAQIRACNAGLVGTVPITVAPRSASTPS